MCVLTYCHLLSARLNGEDSMSTDFMKTLAQQLEIYMYAITTELFPNSFSHMRMHVHMYTHTHEHTHMNTLIHTRTHTLHTYRHTCKRILVLPYAQNCSMQGSACRLDETMKKVDGEHEIDIHWTPHNSAYQEADAAINSAKQVLTLTSMKKKVQEMSYLLTTRKRFGGNLLQNNAVTVCMYIVHACYGVQPLIP